MDLNWARIVILIGYNWGMGMRSVYVESAVAMVATGKTGTYYWNLVTNTVMANAGMASIFHLPSGLVRQGLPIEHFIQKIHMTDRGAVAKALHDAIVSGAPYHQNYRVIDACGDTTHVMAYGQCFRDSSGMPSHCVGTVFAMVDPEPESRADSLLMLCQTAQNYAKSAQNRSVSQLLEQAVMQLSQGQASAPLTNAATRH